MDRRKHRGPHPEDAGLFGEKALPVLRNAVRDHSWLLSGGYPVEASLQLVGNRYDLDARQRLAVRRAACSESERAARAQKRVGSAAVRGEVLLIDGFNQIITVESALSGGVLLHCRDGCFRDMSSVHGSYRRVAETEAALVRLGKVIAELKPEAAVWFLDRPVGNSGRLAGRMRALAADSGWNWRLELVDDADGELCGREGVLVTSDSRILNGGRRWFNLHARLLPDIDKAWIVELNAHLAR